MIRFTQFGLNALAAAAAGITTITFTDVKTSDTGEITTGEYEDFVSIKQTTSPTRIDYDEMTNTAVIAAGFSNVSLGAAYTIKAVGIYCTCAGEFEMLTPRLFAYEMFDDVMPLPTDSPTSYTYSFNTTISSPDAVTIHIEAGTYALASDLQTLEAKVTEFTPRYKEVRCNNSTPDVSRSGFTHKQEVAIPGMTDKYWATGVVSSGTFKGIVDIETRADKLVMWFSSQPSSALYIMLTYFKTDD